MTVTYEAHVRSALVVREPQLAFAVLEGTFDRESTEADPQGVFGPCAFGRLDQEVFFLTGTKNIAGVDQQVRAANPTIAMHPEWARAMLPNDGPLLGLLDVTLDPRLAVDLVGMPAQIVDPLGAAARRAASSQPCSGRKRSLSSNVRKPLVGSE